MNPKLTRAEKMAMALAMNLCGNERIEFCGYTDNENAFVISADGEKYKITVESM